MPQVLSDLDFVNSAKIKNLPNPVDPQDAATRSYVDSAVEGLAWKDNVRVSTGTNINLASPGATLDGIAMATNDRVLVMGQTTANQNGIYIWNGAAVPMTRAPDASTFTELEQATVTVDEGTNATSTFRQSEINGVIDTDDVLWTAAFSSAPAATESSAGIAEIATQAEVDTGTDNTRFVTPEKLAGWSGRTRRHSQAIGDGSANSYAVTHNFGTRNVEVSVYRNSGNYDQVMVDVERTNVNTVTINFAAAVASNAYNVIVIA